MANGVRCDTCGTEVPSLGSLQMHQMRYHASRSRPTASSLPSTSGGPAGGRKGASGRSGAVPLLALTIVALLSGGAFAATRPWPAGPTRAEMQAAIHRAVLTRTDFPAGWNVSPPDPDDGHDLDRSLATCLGGPFYEAGDDDPYEARVEFESGGLHAGSEFWIAPSLEEARAGLERIRGTDAPGCVEQAFRKAGETEKRDKGTTFDVKVTRADVPPSVAGEAAGVRVALTMHQGKANVPVVYDLMLVQHGRIGVGLGFGSIGSPAFPAALKESLTNAVVSRLAV